MAQKHSSKVVDFSKLSEQSRNELKPLVVGKTNGERISGLAKAQDGLKGRRGELQAALEASDAVLRSEERATRRGTDQLPQFDCPLSRAGYFLKIDSGTVLVNSSLLEHCNRMGAAKETDTVVVTYREFCGIIGDASKRFDFRTEVFGNILRGAGNLTAPLGPEEKIPLVVGNLRLGLKRTEPIVKNAAKVIKCSEEIGQCELKLAFVQASLVVCDGLSRAYAKKEEAEKSLNGYPQAQAALERDAANLLTSQSICEEARGLRGEISNLKLRQAVLRKDAEKFENRAEALRAKKERGVQLKYDDETWLSNESNLRRGLLESAEKLEEEIGRLSARLERLEGDGVDHSAAMGVFRVQADRGHLEQQKARADRMLGDSKERIPKLDAEMRRLEAFLSNSANIS